MGNSCLQAGLVLWVVICLSLSGIVASETMNLSRCKKHELQALLKLKHSFTKGPINRLLSWVGEDCCQWRGVGCDDFTGNVIKLNLRAHPLYNQYGDIDCDSKSKFSLLSSEFDSALLELEHLSHLDLSWNDFNGSRIPEFIGSLKHLRYLNLSQAGLVGPIPPHLGSIPEALGNMGLLESLDLSNNRLSGAIPESLSAIKWLEVLNLSNKNLRGPIPTGRQLQTLTDASIYTGNPGLCGFPLPNKCTKPVSPPSMESVEEGDDEEEDKRDKLWLYLAIMLGVTTGFWGVVFTLVLKKNWRHAYFRLMEEVENKIYVMVKVRVNRLKRKSEEANSG